MIHLLIYAGKVAAVLLVFYCFYRFLLKRETFHRLNRLVLVGTALLSFLLPLCIITIHRPLAWAGAVAAPAAELTAELAPVLEKSQPWWLPALSVLFWGGVAFVLVRGLISVFSILRLLRQGERAQAEDGCKIIVTDRDIAPFSWMRCIVLSREDWEGERMPILAHERAHIALRHSADILLVDVLSAFQWFNPAIWMLRADLQELHEYEADDAVLRAGIPVKDYQYLLIRKAAGRSGYSPANRFNHSILKNRITMMSKSPSPRSRAWRLLYLLPLVCLCIGVQAQTVYEPAEESHEKEQRAFRIKPEHATPLFILRQAWGEEKEITRAELDKLEHQRINSVEVLKDSVARERYGERGAHGVIVVTMKQPQELEEIVVVSYGDKDEMVPFYLVKPETMPTFQGEDMMAFSRWLNARISRPKGCHHVGTMRLSFVVGTDGVVTDVRVINSVCEALDAHVASLIEQSPKWEPATSNGRPVTQCLTIPIVFQMR